MGTESIREGFVKLLDEVGLPETERKLIRDELEHGYPWLDRLYAERSV